MPGDGRARDAAYAKPGLHTTYAPQSDMPNAVEKLNLHWKSHMDQYDHLSNPQSQSPLPYLISCQPTTGSPSIYRAPLASTPLAKDQPWAMLSKPWPGRPSFPSQAWGTSSAPYGRDPNWRSQQISFLHSAKSRIDRPAHGPTLAARRALPRSSLRSSSGHGPSDQGASSAWKPTAQDHEEYPSSSSSRLSSPEPRCDTPSPLPSPVPAPLTRRLSGAKARSTGAAAEEVVTAQKSESPPAQGPHDLLQLPSVDPAQVEQLILEKWRSYFAPVTGTEHQPHLDLLRKSKRDLERRVQEGDPDALAEIQEARAARRRTLDQARLTEAEKKANHVASEQRRRANIRKGYEVLSQTLASSPTWKGELGDEGDDPDTRMSTYSELDLLEEAVRTLQGRLHLHRDLLQRKAELQTRILASGSRPTHD